MSCVPPGESGACHISQNALWIKKLSIHEKEGHPAICAECDHVSGEQNMMRFIPTHPSQNRHLEDGVYTAEIRDIEERIYNIDSHLIHLLLWLPEEGVHL